MTGTAVRTRSAEAAFDLSAPIAWPIRSIAYLLLAGTCVQFRAAAILNHDVAWLMVAADRWLDGAILGREIVELNSPAAVALYLPAAVLVRLIGITPNISVAIFTVTMAAISALLAARSVVWRSGLANGSRLGFLIAILLFAIMALSLSYDFAQRDHFIAMMFLPYVVLHAPLPDNAYRTQPPYLLAAATAVLVASAACIKPQYAILFVLIFVPLAWSLGIGRAWRQCWASQIAAIGVLYAGAVYWLFPEWISVALQAKQLYAAYDMPTRALLTRSIPVVLALLAAISIANLRVRFAEVVGMCVLLGMGVVAIALVQGKGWYYHFLAADLLLGSALVIVFVGFLPVLARHSKHAILIALLIFLMPVYFGARSHIEGVKRRLLYESSDLTTAIRSNAKRGETIGFIATSLPPAFPLVVEEGYVWASRYPALWPLAGAVTLNATGKIDISMRDRILDDVFSNVLSDFQHYRPKLIVVDQNEEKLRVPDGFSFLPVFLRYPAFHALWSNYQFVELVDGYAIYVRNDH